MIKYAKKTTTAESLTKALKALSEGESLIYGTGKLPASEYHKVRTLSASTAKDLLDPSISDYYFHRKHVKRDLPVEQNDAFNIGKALHTLVLEPELFGADFSVAPDVDRRTKEGRETWLNFTAALGKRTPLTNDQYQLASEMAKAIRGNKFACELLSNTHKEASAFHKFGDVVLKGRADAVSYGNYCVDVKTTDDASPKGFANAAAKYRYDIQEWFYKKLFGCEDFIFIVVSKVYPHEVGIYRLNDQFAAKAEQQMPEAIRRYLAILSADEPESFTSDENPLTELAPPSWFNFL